MNTSLKNYTLRYSATISLIIIAIWATLFYAVILDELYDNTDDGLKDLKIQIIREAYINEDILKIDKFDFNQFRITAINPSQYKEGNFFRNELFYMEYDDEMEPYRVLETFFIDKKGECKKLEIRTSTVEEDDFRLDLFIALICLYIFLVISIVFINNILLYKIWKPFYSIIDSLGKYEFGKGKKLKDNKTKISEFQLLNDKLNEMIIRNEDIYIQQKEFIENASHELQTPLSIAINKLDLLIESEEITDQNLIELTETRKGLMRLVKLNKSLLMLTRIENNQFNEKQTISINNSIKHLLSDLQDMIEFKKIEIQLSEKNELLIEMNPDLAYILISNLIINAIKYNKPNGYIYIDITNDAFTVKNSTADNQPLHAENIFNRFYKINQDHNSTGLGLSIVKTIINKHPEYSIEYSFDKNLHGFTFKIKKS